jgi:hypothetical protein
MSWSFQKMLTEALAPGLASDKGTTQPEFVRQLISFGRKAYQLHKA